MCFDNDMNRAAVVEAGGIAALEMLIKAQPGTPAAQQARAALDLLHVVDFQVSA